MLAKIAWRNLWRNKGRTAIVMSAIAFSYGLMLMMFGVAQDSYRQMGDSIVEAVGGHVLIHGHGYWEMPTGGQKVADPEALRGDLEAMDEVEAVAARVMGFGLLGTAQSSEGAQIMGIDPGEEEAFLGLEDRLVEGELLSEESRSPIVIAADDAERLGVEMGDRLVVTGSEIDGDVTRGLFFVDGILESIPGQVGEATAYVHRQELQELLGYGEGVTQVGVRLYDESTRHAVAHRLRGQWEVGEGALEVMTWDEAVPEFQALIDLDQGFTIFYLLVIIVIVVLGITNTFMMAVMERIREIGLLSALGMEPRRIGAMVMVETVILAILGMGVGLMIGLGAHLYIADRGIDIAQLFDEEIEMSGIAMDMVIYSHFDPLWWGLGSVVVLVSICLSALYPAYRAAQKAPAEAMRFHE